MTPDEFRTAGHAMVDRIAAYLDSVGEQRIVPDIAPGDVYAALPPTAPADEGKSTNHQGKYGGLAPSATRLRAASGLGNRRDAFAEVALGGHEIVHGHGGDIRDGPIVVLSGHSGSGE